MAALVKAIDTTIQNRIENMTRTEMIIATVIAVLPTIVTIVTLSL